MNRPADDIGHPFDDGNRRYRETAPTIKRILQISNNSFLLIRASAAAAYPHTPPHCVKCSARSRMSWLSPKACAGYFKPGLNSRLKPPP